MHHLNDVLTNILEVWQVSSIDGSSVLNSPQAFAQLTSPVSVSGAALAGGSVLGQVLLYDDMFTTVGSSGPIRGSAPAGYAQFTASIRYQLNARGLQEGVLAFYSTTQSNVALSNQITLIKVFLGA